MKQYNKTIQKIINLDYVTKGNIYKHNPNWSRIPDHPYRILQVRGSGCITIKWTHSNLHIFRIKGHRNKNKVVMET